MDFRLAAANFKYILLPSKQPKNATFKDLHNSVYRFWKSTWQENFSLSGALPDGHWLEHFLRQDIIAVVMYGNEIAGCHLYTLYNLNSVAATENEYFHYFSKDSFAKLEDSKLNHVMSMEYLCANPKWRKSQTGISMGELVLGLGLNVSQSCGFDCAVGTAIMEAKADKIAKKFGGFSIQDEIKKYGYTLSLMVMPSQPPASHPEKDLDKLLRHLWLNRIDYTGLTVVNPAAIAERKI